MWLVGVPVGTILAVRWVFVDGWKRVPLRLLGFVPVAIALLAGWRIWKMIVVLVLEWLYAQGWIDRPALIHK